MATYKIAWMPGDGVGNDVMNATRIVLNALNLDAEYIPADIGWEFWCTEGNPLPDRTIDILKKTDCALFGAITSKPRDEANDELDPSLRGKGLSYFSPIVKLRQLFNLHTNLRPCKAYPGNPLNFEPKGANKPVDLVVFRENTEGLYVMMGGHLKKGTPDEVATEIDLNTRKGVERIVRHAFEHARRCGRRRVAMADKANVLIHAHDLWRRVFAEVAAAYPEIEATALYADNAALQLVREPGQFEVLVTSNMFGDILTDLAAALQGGLGMAASGNVHPGRFGLFEPVHGSAPAFAGRDVANPFGAILSAGMLLDYVGWSEEAVRIETAVRQAVECGETTRDVGGRLGTRAAGAAVAARLRA
jgi:3-isopropylmalate dehydrogenase